MKLKERDTLLSLLVHFSEMNMHSLRNRDYLAAFPELLDDFRQVDARLTGIAFWGSGHFSRSCCVLCGRGHSTPVRRTNVGGARGNVNIGLTWRSAMDFPAGCGAASSLVYWPTAIVIPQGSSPGTCDGCFNTCRGSRRECPGIPHPCPHGGELPGPERGRVHPSESLPRRL